MTLETRPLHPLFGVEILDVDVRRVDAEVFKRIVDAFEEHSVLLFRGQPVTSARLHPLCRGRPRRAMNSGKAASARAPLTTFVV
jgi:alpha-ketoglutarate-dependent taurine dioxygenase